MASLSTIFIVIFLFLLGTALGSFLNVWSRRLLRGRPPTGRSRCEHCKHVLAPFDLIPLLSFIGLRGRCRYCKKPLSWQYPIVEAGTGILFAALWFAGPSSSIWWLAAGYWLALAVSVSALITIFITDFEKQVIYDQTLWIALYGALLYRFLLIIAHSPLTSIFYDLAAAAVVYLFFWSIRFFTKGKGMGEGDAPLAFIVALLVGYPLVLVLLFTAFTVGGIVGVVLVALKKRHLKDRIAFGPFLVAAALFTIFFGQWVLDWYLGILGL